VRTIKIKSFIYFYYYYKTPSMDDSDYDYNDAYESIEDAALDLYYPSPENYHSFEEWCHAIKWTSARYGYPRPSLSYSKIKWLMSRPIQYPAPVPAPIQLVLARVRNPPPPPPSAPSPPPPPLPKITYPAAPCNEEEPPAPADTPDEKLCVICLGRLKVVAAVPCGHVCTCVTCAATGNLTQCPLCRTPLVMMMKTIS
jgi:hypothetical protein